MALAGEVGIDVMKAGIKAGSRSLLKSISVSRYEFMTPIDSNKLTHQVIAFLRELAFHDRQLDPEL